MSSEEQLVETHVMEYESRLKHIDELIEHTEKKGNLNPGHAAELSELKQDREKLVDNLDEIRRKSAEEWAKEGGPMVIWDLVAERLEKLVEHLE